MDRLEKLQALLSRMRAQTWGTKAERAARQDECWYLWGAIEDLKNGRTPVLEGSAKYLRWVS